jgi:hypothetical protein
MYIKVCPRCNKNVGFEISEFEKYKACPRCKAFVVNREFNDLKGLKIGYNYWGYLTDKPGISSPDGNATYSIWILGELMKRGFKVYGPPINRDSSVVEEHGYKAFKSFSNKKRWNIYNDLEFMDLDNLPELDVLLLEWRFPTKDNQKKPNEEGYSPDLDIQTKLIKHYSKKDTKIIIFDLDYKLNNEDIERIKPWKILETAVEPKNGESVFIPFDFSELSQFSKMIPKRDKLFVYIGNNYERDEDFNNKLIPMSNKNPKKVHLVGNWLKDKYKDFRNKNKNIVYHDRISFDKFLETYQDAIAVPLLAKEEYKKRGFMTMRIIESLLFGSIPVGFSDFKDINKFLPDELIINMKNFESSSTQVIEHLQYLSLFERLELRKSVINKLSKFMDVKFFVNKMLGGIKIKKRDRI